MLAMAPTDPRCTIGTKIETKAVHVTSLDELSRSYGENKKTGIIVGTVLEVEIGPKATVLGRRSTFLLQNSTLAEETQRWTQSTSGVSSSTLRNLLVLLLVVMVGRGLMLPPQIIPETQLSQIQYLFKLLDALAPDQFNDEAFRVVVVQSNGQNARPAALSIDIGLWVSSWGCFSPCDGFIHCGYSSTSSNSLTTSTSSNSFSSSTSSSITSHTGSV